MNENTQNIDKMKGDLHTFLINELLKLDKKKLPISKLINEIQSLFSEYCYFTENQFYFEDKNYEKYNELAKSSEQFVNLIKNNSESGILDWCAEQNKSQMLPNIDLNTNEFFQQIFIHPITSINSVKIYFVGTVAEVNSKHITQNINNLSSVIDIAFLILQSQILIEANSNQNSKINKDNQALAAVAFNYVHNSYNNFYFQYFVILHKTLQAQFLLSKTNPEMVARRMEIMGSNINELANLSTQLNFNPNFEKIIYKRMDLDDFLKHIVANITPILDNLDIQIQFLPYNQSVWINTDEQLLSLSIFAILLNSIESIESSGKIDLILQEHDSRRISLSIIDSGSGFELPKEEMLFQPFSSFNKKSGHLGLSLFLVKYFTEKTKAKIFISSEINKGTTVKLIFNKAIL